MASGEEDGIASYYQRVRRYLARFANRRYAAEDLAQDTFAQAYEAIRNRGPPEQPLPWLMEIAHRTGVSRVRKERRRPKSRHMEDSLTAGGSQDALAEMTAREDQAVLYKALGQLRSRDAALLVGYYMEERSCRELAEDLGMTEDSVKVGLYRARLRLRKLLEE